MNEKQATRTVEIDQDRLAVKNAEKLRKHAQLKSYVGA